MHKYRPLFSGLFDFYLLDVAGEEDSGFLEHITYLFSIPKGIIEIVEAAKLDKDLGFYSVTLPTPMTTPPAWLFTDIKTRELLDARVIVPAIAAATSRI